METVSLSFRYSEEDYVRALRAHYATRLRLRLDLALVIVVFGLSVYVWRFGSPVLGTILLFVSAMFALLLIAAFTVFPHYAFRRQPKFRDEYSLTFSPEGIHFRTTHIDSQLQWSLYSHALVDAHSFVLYYGSQQFTIIPRRVFQDTTQRESFERLLARNVPKVIDQTK